MKKMEEEQQEVTGGRDVKGVGAGRPARPGVQQSQPLWGAGPDSTQQEIRNC